ncbi:hypothetical protein T09_15349 [Trichinella sp. T9]|nr:hypothetical protein T09_15349 [Trichinella sp. T9]
MALRSAQKGCNTPRFLSLSSPVDFMMKTTDFTLKIPSLHWCRLSDTVNTIHYTGSMPSPGAKRIMN